MAKIITTLDHAVDYINSLYEADSTAPTSGDEDYTVWTALINISINIWESEEGVLWNELFIKLADAPDGDTTITASTWSYDCPSLFKFHACGYVRVGTGTNKTYYKVIKPQDKQLYDNNSDNWCYFLNGSLEFNPNCTLTTGATINYEYYASATKMTTSTDEFQMSDPMFAVFYVLSVLKQEEGDPQPANIASQKLESMKTLNEMPSWFQSEPPTDTEGGFGV